MSDHPFAGFNEPQQNYSKLPHAFIDAAHLFSSQAEVMVVLYILRHTWGFSEYDQPKKITLDEFEHGRKTAKGKRIDSGCGMSRRSIQRGLADAEKHGFITIETDDSDKARLKRWYCIRMAASFNEENRGATLTPRESGQDDTSSWSDVSRDQRKKPKKETEKDNKPQRTALRPAAELNPIKDAIVNAFGWSWERMSKTEKGRVQKTAAELFDANQRADNVPALYACCKRKYEQFGPNALCGVVSEVASKPSALNGKPHTMSPAAPEPDAGEYLTPAQFKAMKEAQQS